MRRRLAHCRPGERLPIGQDLAAEFRVDMVTVKRALAELVAEGLIVRRPRHGTFATERVASLKKILWVTAVAPHQSTSQYWSDHVRFVERNLADRGYSMDLFWRGPKTDEQLAALVDGEWLDAYLGFGFLTALDNPFCEKIVGKGLPHVAVGEKSVANGVKLDVEHIETKALRHLAAKGHRRVSCFIHGQRSADAPSAFNRNMKVEFTECCGSGVGQAEIEANSYHVARKQIDEDRLAPAVLVTDDVVARGVTRAILNARSRLPDVLDVVVVCGRQEIIPLGLPVTYLAHDVEWEAGEAVRILIDQIEGISSGPAMVVSPYEFVQGGVA